MKPFTIVAFALACLTVAVFARPAQAAPHVNMHTSKVVKIAAGGCYVTECHEDSHYHRQVCLRIYTSHCSAPINPNVMSGDRYTRNPNVLSVPNHGGGGPHQSTGGSIIWQRQNIRGY